MTLARDTTAANIKPLEGARIRRYEAGGSIAAGEIVAINSNGDVVAANTSLFSTSVVMGIALTAVSDTQKVDVVTFGPVVCLTGSAIGDFIYASNTDGEPSTSVGTKDVCVGITESATVLFVRPQFIDFS